MPSVSKYRIRGLLGTGFVSWIMLSVSLFTPEWIRQGDKHCGVMFCCLELYGNCVVTNTAVVGDELAYIFSSWLMSIVAICSSACRCTNVTKDNVRQTAILLLVSGVLALTGSTEFFIRKFTNEELDFGAGGFVAHAAAWMLFVSGCCGFCHGYDYKKAELHQMYPFDVRSGNISSGLDPATLMRNNWNIAPPHGVSEDIHPSSLGRNVMTSIENET